jgi:hypothetical protein
MIMSWAPSTSASAIPALSRRLAGPLLRSITALGKDEMDISAFLGVLNRTAGHKLIGPAAAKLS